MRAIMAVLAICGVAACQSAVSERNFTAEVIHGLSQNGMAYIQRARQNGDLQRIMQEIAEGNGLLIDNAYLMRRSLQENEAMDLQNSLAMALKHRPDKVLALMPAHYKYDDLCNVPESVDDVNREQYISDAIQVLTDSNTRFKARQQKQCLARFESLNNAASL